MMGSGLHNDMPLAGASKDVKVGKVGDCRSHDHDHVESDGSYHMAVSMWLSKVTWIEKILGRQQAGQKDPRQIREAHLNFAQ